MFIFNIFFLLARGVQGIWGKDIGATGEVCVLDARKIFDQEGGGSGWEVPDQPEIKCHIYP